jgi:hypothetical protein
MMATKGASLMCCLRELEEPRRPGDGTLHDFVEMLVIAMAAALSDCDTVEDIAYWGRTKELWLREFLLLKNGVPSEETFLRIFRAPDRNQFEAAFRPFGGRGSRHPEGQCCGRRQDRARFGQWRGDRDSHGQCLRDGVGQRAGPERGRQQEH